jgi:hypothetical protein
MRPTTLLPLRRKACCKFLSPLKSIALTGSEPANRWFNGKHANHYTTEATWKDLGYSTGLMETTVSMQIRPQKFVFKQKWQTDLTSLLKMTTFWDMAPCRFVEAYQRFIGSYCLYHHAEAVRTSETSVYFYKNTRRHVPEGCHLHTHPPWKPKNLTKFNSIITIS